MALKDQGTYPLRLFDLMTETVLGGKDIIYQPVMRMFHWTIPIQFFQSQVGFPPRAHSCYSYYRTIVFDRIVFGDF